MLLKERMKELLEDMLLVLNSLPNRRLRGKEWTTYDLAKRVEAELELINALNQSPSNSIEDRTFRK